ncbi:MAG: ABC transporter substrate-binding protein [Chloroflexota bacterium]
MRILAVVLLLFAATGCAPARPPTASSADVGAPALTKVQVALGFVPSVQSAPFYLAQDRGYYAAQGLELELRYGTVANLLSLVSTGEVTFAASGGDLLMPQRQQGVAVTYIMTFWNRNPIGALGLAGRNTPPLRTPADLKGKTIGVSAPHGSTHFGLEALLGTAGLHDADITLVAIGTTEVEALLQGRIDAAMTFLPNEAAQMKSLGQPVETVAVADHVKYIPPGFVTGDTTIRQHPDLVQKFVNATLHGLRDALVNPTAAFDSSLTRMPELSVENRPLQRDVLTATLEYYGPPARSTLGASDPDAWAATQEVLRAAGTLSETREPRTYYDNSFIEHASQ